MNVSRLPWRKVLLVSVFVSGTAALLTWYFMPTVAERLQAAERRAHAFCDAIAIGSNISTAVSKAKADGVFWGSAQGYTFYFPATGFDKAVCEVTVDQRGKVVARRSEMEYD